MSDLYRVEIISNQSVQEDIIERLEKDVPEIEYSIIPEVHGSGRHTKKLGDTVWPEMNFLFFAYVEEPAARKIKEAIEDIKVRFPKEGISLFFTSAIQQL